MASRKEIAYDLEALKRHQQKRRDNIAIFEAAIAQERHEMAREQRIIETLEADLRACSQ